MLKGSLPDALAVVPTVFLCRESFALRAICVRSREDSHTRAESAESEIADCVVSPIGVIGPMLLTYILCEVVGRSEITAKNHD